MADVFCLILVLICILSNIATALDNLEYFIISKENCKNVRLIWINMYVDGRYIADSITVGKFQKYLYKY